MNTYSKVKYKIEYLKLRLVFFLKQLKIQKRFSLKNKMICASPDIVKKHKAKWGKLTNYVPRLWIDWYYSVSGIENIDCPPEDIYYAIIEPILNDRRLVLAYADKNFYEKFLDVKLFPEAILRNVNGVFLDRDYNPLAGDGLSMLEGDKIVVKPSLDSGGGKNVHVFSKLHGGEYQNKFGALLTNDFLNQTYGSNYLIQHAVEQHPGMARFNPTSVNTIRMMTYRSVRDNQVKIICSVLRVGGAGSVVDNQTAGGVAFLIKKDGSPEAYGVDACGNKFFEFNGINYKDEGPINKYFEMQNLAIKLADKLPYFHLLGFDFCLDKDQNIVVLEINTNYLGITFFLLHGQGLFNEYTDEVIDYCSDFLKRENIAYF